MAYDTHCVACGVSFSEKRVTRHARTKTFKLHHIERHYVDEYDENEDCECPFCDGTYDDDDENGCEIDCDYDCGVIQQDDTTWTETVQVLGFNEEVSGIRKAFMSGEGQCDDNGTAEVEPGNDKNEPWLITTFPCYEGFGEEAMATFPFHPQCFEVLKHAGGHNVQLDVLYEVLKNQSYECQAFSKLCYGKPSPKHDQFWRCRPGEEFMVVDPMEVSNLNPLFDRVLDQIRCHRLKLVDLGERVRRDPFAYLPNEVLHEIANYLPTKSVPALMRASWSVNASLASPVYWNNLVRTRFPWFRELHDFIKSSVRSPLVSKQLFFWAQAVTRPRRWMEGPMMAIANRRRIWDTCEQILDLYNNHISRCGHHFRDQTLRNMVDHAEVLHMPYISYFANCEDAESIISFWISDDNQLKNDTLTFETFWEQKSLVGISVTSLGQRRPLGRCVLDDTVSGVETLVLTGDDWVQGFVLHMQDPSLCGDDTYSCIEGIDVVFQSGKVISLGAICTSYPASCQRPLYVSEDRRLVGLTAVVARNRISRLGLIQCRFPLLDQSTLDPEDPEDSDDLPDSGEKVTPLPDIRQFLWRSTLEDDLGDKLWNIRSLAYTELGEEGVPFRSTIPNDLTPRHPLLFAPTIDELGSVTKLWALSTFVDFHGNFPRTGNKVDRLLVAGMCVERLIKGEVSVNYAGYDANMGPQSVSTPSSDSSIEDEDRSQIQSFDIDGPGGERVTEVTACRIGETLRSIKFRTNKDREVIFGDTQQPHESWVTCAATKGKSIIGISLAFGVLGWDRHVPVHLSKTKRLVSRVGILTMEGS